MINFFRDISVRNKLIISFGIIVFIIVAIGLQELLLLRNLNNRRIELERADEISKLLEKTKFTINSDFVVLSDLNIAQKETEIQDAILVHISNTSNFNKFHEKILRDLKVILTDTNKVKMVLDSLDAVYTIYKTEINTSFEQILKNKYKLLNIDNYYTESGKIVDSDTTVYDSLSNVSGKLELANSLNSFIETLNNYVHRQGNIAIRKLESSGKLVSSIEEKMKTNYTELYDSKINEIFIILIILILITIAISLIVIRIILNPLHRFRSYFTILTKGELPEILGFNSNDEIGEIGKLILKLVEGLRKTANFSIDIGKGNFKTKYKPLGKEDILGNSLLAMRDSLQKARKDEEKRKTDDMHRNRTSEGLSLFSEILRHNTENIKELSDEIISNLVQFMKANQGGIFILNDDNKNDIWLELMGAYAYNRKKYISKKLKIGEGLVGAVALEKYTVYMTDVPNEYVQIESGIGSSNPKSILIVPLKIEEQILGVIEIASFNEFEPYEITLVERIAENIASTLSTARINTRTAQLLEKSKIQAAKMLEQEEEMLQNIEELKATQEESNNREGQLENAYKELNNTSKILKEKDLKQKDEIKKLQELNRKHIEMIKNKETLSTIILETSINGIVLLNDKFEIEEFNNAAERHFGYKKEDIIGKKIQILMTKDMRERAEKDPDFMSNGFLTEGKEGTVIAVDGNEVPVFYSITKFNYQDTVKYSAFFKNISWEKQSEKARNLLLEKTAAHEFELSTRVERLEKLLEKYGVNYEQEINENELIKWDGTLSIGLDIIDQQHKRWVEIINKLYASFKQGVALDKLFEVIAELTEYTDYHFGFEEKYMSELNYEENEAHLKIHHDFVDKLHKFKNDYKEGKIDVAYNLMSYLRPWVKHHILKVDKPYVDLFRKNGLN